MSFFEKITIDYFRGKSNEQLERIRINHKIDLEGAREALRHLPPSSYLGYFGTSMAIRRLERELGWINEILRERSQKDAKEVEE